MKLAIYLILIGLAILGIAFLFGLVVLIINIFKILLIVAGVIFFLYLCYKVTSWIDKKFGS